MRPGCPVCGVQPQPVEAAGQVAEVVGARGAVLVRLLLGGAAGLLQTRIIPQLAEVLHALIRVRHLLITPPVQRALIFPQSRRRTLVAGYLQVRIMTHLVGSLSCPPAGAQPFQPDVDSASQFACKSLRFEI